MGIYSALRISQSKVFHLSSRELKHDRFVDVDKLGDAHRYESIELPRFSRRNILGQPRNRWERLV